MDPMQFETEALVASVFKDDYALDPRRLDSLYSKAKRHQWNAELDVDWRHVDPESEILDQSGQVLSRLAPIQELPDAVRRRVYREAAVFTMSQVLHGEQAALMVCGQLVNAVPDLDGKFAAAAQVIDEARHVEVFARYLKTVGHHYPIDPDLQRIVAMLLAEQDWEAKCVGMQVILESVALAFFRLGESMAVDPLLRQFIGRVHEDESRHVAYGVLTLEERIPALTADARQRLEDFAYDAVTRIAGRAGVPTFASQMNALARAGVDLAKFLPRLVAEFQHPERIDWEGLDDPMTQTVLPNLLRVGLIPERLRDGYLAQGFRIDLAAGTVEDLHSFHPDARAARQEIQARGKTVLRPV
jgi:hypothetical protein